VRQPEPLGSADCRAPGLDCAPGRWWSRPTPVFRAGDVARFAAVDGHAIAARREPPPSPPQPLRARRSSTDASTKVLDDDPANRARVGAAVAAGRRPSIRAAGRGSAGRRFELSQAFQLLVDAGETVPRRRDRPDPRLDASA
jgi:hypothetical protein